MPTKEELKRLQSLAQKKFRKAYGCFLVEGEKMCAELQTSALTCTALYYVPQRLGDSGILATAQVRPQAVTEKEMERISGLSTPPAVAAVARIPQEETWTLRPEGLYLALDGVRDPGNLGTLLRLADWFGLDGVLLSPDCVDLYNPKTVQATMGALFRVRTQYTPLDGLLASLGPHLPVYATVLEGGKNLYASPLENRGVIVMGSESHGIRPACLPADAHRLYIPPYPADSPGSESLNVAVAAAVICAEFRRRGAQ